MAVGRLIKYFLDDHPADYFSGLAGVFEPFVSLF
jgi:hypothetical protein